MEDEFREKETGGKKKKKGERERERKREFLDYWGGVVFSKLGIITCISIYKYYYFYNSIEVIYLVSEYVGHQKQNQQCNVSCYRLVLF